jgi:tRNA (guanine-N7-)-methyltransferase
MTRGQARAFTELAPRFLLSAAQPLAEPGATFGRRAPLGLEIGFGMGHALLDWAAGQPQWNLLGVDVYQPGIGAALLGLEAHGLDNVRLIEAPAEHVLDVLLPPDCLDEVRIFFPDPWPKKRHHKRRLVQPALAQSLAERLRPEGALWLATDWEPYAHWMVEVLDAQPALQRDGEPRVTAGSTERPRLTRFEHRGLRLGHRVWDLRYHRKR